MKPLSEIRTLRESLSDDLFICCTSFEAERAVAASTLLHRRYHARAAIILNLTSQTDQSGRKKQHQATERLLSLLERVDDSAVPRLMTVGPYDYRRALHGISEEIRLRNIRRDNLHVTIDFSCFTRIHLVFLLRFLLSAPRAQKIRLLYTSPRGYNAEGDKFNRLGRATFQALPVPLRPSLQRSLSGYRRVALVLLGHEGQRTIAGWQRLDPDETILLFPQSDDSQMRKMCERENEFLLHQSSGSRSAVRVIQCSPRDIASAQAVLDEQLRLLGPCRDYRLSIIPFGPKPILVGALLAVLEQPHIDASLMYPIPNAYNSSYSSGVVQTYVAEI